MPIFLNEHPVRQERALEEFQTPFRSYLRAKFDDAWDNNFTPMAVEGAELGLAYRAPERLSMEDANLQIQSAGVKGLQIPDDGIPEPALKILIDRKKRQMANEDAINRSPTGFRSVAGFGASLVAGLLDPINVATAFVPVVGEARYALALASASGGLERAGIRAAVGGLQGAAGMAAIEPFSYAMHQGLRDDYKMLDSLMNIGFGGVLGGVIHAGGGAIGDMALGRYARAAVGADGGSVTGSTLAGAAARAAEPPFQMRATGRDAPTILGEVMADSERRAKIEDTPGFLRTQEDKIALAQPHTYAESLTPELERGIEIAQKPGAFRSAEEKIFLKSMMDGREADYLNDRLGRALGDGNVIEAAAVMRRFAEIGRNPNDARLLLDRVSTETKDAAMRTAIAQSLEGKYPDLAAVIQSDPKSGMPNTDPAAAIRETAERQSKPGATRVADPQASADATQRIAEAPKSHDLKAAEAEMAKIESQMIERNQLAGVSKETVKEAMAAADENVAHADEYAKAAMAAMSCGAR